MLGAVDLPDLLETWTAWGGDIGIDHDGVTQWPEPPEYRCILAVEADGSGPVLWMRHDSGPDIELALAWAVPVVERLRAGHDRDEDWLVRPSDGRLQLVGRLIELPPVD